MTGVRHHSSQESLSPIYNVPLSSMPGYLLATTEKLGTGGSHLLVHVLVCPLCSLLWPLSPPLMSSGVSDRLPVCHTLLEPCRCWGQHLPQKFPTRRDLLPGRTYSNVWRHFGVSYQWGAIVPEWGAAEPPWCVGRSHGGTVSCCQ